MGISQSIFPTHDAGLGGGVLYTDFVLRRFNWVLGRLLWDWEEKYHYHDWDKGTQTFYYLFLWRDETEWWLCWFCLLKFKIHPVRGKHAEVACENFCLAPILWTGKFWTPIFLSARRADQNVRGLVLNRSNNSCGRLNHWMEVSCFFMPEEKISNFQLCSIACPHWLTPDCHQWDQDLDCARPWSSVTWHTMPIDMVEPFFRITEGFPEPKYSQQWCTA